MKTSILAAVLTLFSGLGEVLAVLPADGAYTGRATVTYSPSIQDATKPITARRSEVVKAVVIPYNSPPYDRLLVVTAPLDSRIFEIYSNSNYQNSPCIAAIRFNSISAGAAIDFVGNQDLTSTVHGNVSAVNVSFTNEGTAVNVRSFLTSGKQVLTVVLTRLK